MLDKILKVSLNTRLNVTQEKNVQKSGQSKKEICQVSE